MLREILEQIKKVNEIEFDNINGQSTDWDGSLSLSGIKRLIYGIWHDGFNEKGEDMTHYMDHDAYEMYMSLIENYSKLPEILIKFNNE